MNMPSKSFETPKPPETALPLPDWREGCRIVDLWELAQQMNCEQCSSLLDLNRTTWETRAGLASVLYIVCHCGVTNKVQTSKRQTIAKTTNTYFINIQASSSAQQHCRISAEQACKFLNGLGIPVTKEVFDTTDQELKTLHPVKIITQLESLATCQETQSVFNEIENRPDFCKHPPQKAMDLLEPATSDVVLCHERGPAAWAIMDTDDHMQHMNTEIQPDETGSAEKCQEVWQAELHRDTSDNKKKDVEDIFGTLCRTRSKDLLLRETAKVTEVQLYTFNPLKTEATKEYNVTSHLPPDSTEWNKVDKKRAEAEFSEPPSCDAPAAMTGTTPQGNNPGSITALPSARPELRTTSFYQADHDYLAATGRPFIECLKKCLPAVRLVARHEEALSSENLIGIKDKSFLTKLEKHMLNFAKSEASQGMLYVTLFKHEEIFFARVIESGCLLGSISDGEFKRVLGQAVPGSSGFLSYNVFSDEDLCTQGVKRKAGSVATRDRPDKQFKRAVDVVKKDLGVLKMNVESRPQCCLVGAVIQLLRKNKPNKRFFWGFSKHTRDWQPVEAALQEFRARGTAAPVRVQMSDVTEGTGLQEQLDALGTIGHNFSNVPSVHGKNMADNKLMHYPYCFVICSKLIPGTWPRSFRLRLCHFLLNGEVDEVGRLVNRQMSARSFLSQRPQFSHFQHQQDPSCSTD